MPCGNRQGTLPSARPDLALTPMIRLTFPAWPTSTRASSKSRIPGVPPGVLLVRSDRPNAIVDARTSPVGRDTGLLARETEERGDRHEIRERGGARRGRPDQRLPPAGNRGRPAANAIQGAA